MSKHQVNVDLSFKAQTQQAKQEMADLQQLLSKISNKQIDINVDAASIDAAATAARKLSAHLDHAFDQKTGKFNLGDFDASLKRSGDNVQNFAANLLKMGKDGTNAFVKLSTQIAQAERPVVTLNGKLREMLDTLKNTARWQLSSSILHGFMGALQTAYGYAQDLNASLNDIRIVTGYSTDEMAAFAKEANKAAKALSATTTEYTKASLIYYQQGLSNDDVKARTDITIKLANISRQSAEDVSDQMTAVWNNFYDGSKSLEYYADVMTALGATTASSTEEIAGGLEKFAAIADTIGLSYEYAASALATITSNTRQSEEVVGTALKTIFARIQGLNLGETLEDGTDLNKYSEALKKVGIDIFNASGEIKNMDIILDEMGEKWNSLSKDTQMAVAQAVAGTRQYNQLIALMDNWNSGDSDSFSVNLTTVENAEGTLEEQANIYAESWEAARDRVTASLEVIYSQLLDDKFFIDITNGFANLIDSVSAFIDGIGGIKTILMAVFSYFLSVTSTQIQPAIDKIKQGLEIAFTGYSSSAEKTAAAMRTQTLAILNDETAILTKQQREQLIADNQISEARSKLVQQTKDLSAEEKNHFETTLQRMETEARNVQLMAEQNREKEKSLELLKKEVKLAEEKIVSAGKEINIEKAIKSAGRSREAAEKGLQSNFKQAKIDYQKNASTDNLAKVNAAKKALFEHQQATDVATHSFEKFIDITQKAYVAEMEATHGNISNSESIVKVGAAFESQVDDLSALEQALKNGTVGFTDAKLRLEQLESQFDMASGGAVDFSTEFANLQTAANSTQLYQPIAELINKMKNATIPAYELEDILRDLGQSNYTDGLIDAYNELDDKIEESTTATEEYTTSTKELEEAQNRVNAEFKNFDPKHQISGLEAMVKAGAGLGKIATSAMSIRSAFQALNNEDLTAGEKITTVAMGLMTAIPSMVSGIKDLREGFSNIQAVVNDFSAGFGGLKKRFEDVKVGFDNIKAGIATFNGDVLLKNASDVDILTDALTKEQLAQRTGMSLEQADITLRQLKSKLLVQEALQQNLLGNAEKQKNIAQQLGLTQDQQEIFFSKLKSGASFEEAAAEAGVNIAKKSSIMTSIANVAAKLAETVGTKAKSVADKGETAGIWAKVAAYIAEQAAAWPMLVVTLLIVAAMASLALIVAAVVTVVKALVNAYNADAIAAEKAENAAASLAETYQSTKQAYEDMINAMSEYDTALKSLDELTKGTEEYNEALQKANRAALELINNYPEYFGEGSYKWENGQLILDEDAMANAQQQMAMKESAAYSAAQMGAAEAKHARNKADLTQLARDITPGDATGAAVTTGVVSTLLGGPGSPFGLLALKIGGLTTTIMGVAEASRKNAIELAAQEFQNNENLFDILAQQNTVEGLKEALGTDDNELVMALLSNRDALLENKDSIIELSNNMEAANQAEKLAAQQSFMEAMKATSYSNDKNADRMAYLGGAAYQEAQTEAYDRLLDEMSNKSKLKNYSSDYFDQMGLSSQDGFKVGKYDAKKGTVSYSYTDENGDTQEKEVSAMEIAQTLAVSEAMSSVTSSCQVLSEAFAKLDHDASATSEAMKEFLSTGDTSSLTKEQYDAMASMSEGQLIKYLENLGITEDVAKSMGYDNLSGMVDDMDLDSTGDKWAKYENITSMQGTGGLTLDQAENISSATNALGDFYGTDMANEMTGMMNTTVQALEKNPEAQEAFWSQLGNIEDYTDAQAWDDFLANMAEATDLTADEAAALEGFAKSAALAANATKKLNFDDLKKNVQGLQGVLKSMSSGNRNISDEQMEMLKAQGIDTSKFAKTLDGWRYFGDTGEMVADISDGMRNQFKDVEQNFTNIAEEAAQAQKNVEDAEAALAAAKAAGDEERAKQLQAAKDNVSAFEIIGEMMRHVVDVVTNGIKAAWDWICEVCLGIYDFFVKIFNAIGGGISSAWDTFAGFLENLINGISKAIKTVLEAIGIDTGGWAEVHLQRSGYTPMKTSEEIAAEKELREAEEKLIESTQKIIDATPTLVNSIMSSADYLTEAELEAKKQEMADSKAKAEDDYKAASDVYGKDSPQALYYKALVDSYNEQVKAYDNAIKSRRVLIEDIKKSERYEALNKSLEDLNNELERTSSLKDRAFGAQRVQAMEQEARVLQDLIDKEREYQKEIERDLNDQKTSMATKWGAKFDANGNIANYDELLYNHAGNWDSVKADLDKYNETKTNRADSEDKLVDLQHQVSAGMLEKINYSMEYKLELDDRELEQLDYELSKIEDDFYSTAEAIQFTIGNIDMNGNLIAGGKLNTYLDNLNTYNGALDELNAAYAAGKLTQADYQEGLTTISENAMDTIEQIRELDDTMMNYYGETLEKAQEEIDKYTNKMEHQAAVLDHYKNLLSITGKENNYQAMETILKGQAHLLQNNVKVSKETHEMYAREAAEWKEKMEASIPGSEVFEMYEKAWEEAEAKAQESEDKMLSDLAEWAEAEKAILENTLADLGQQLEKSLTGGMSFDELTTQMERASSLQEEYLTTTNQIYETTKMMRTAQQAIDQSSNSIAKDKLKNFITETKNLQEQGKLSQYELDMQQAKYDLLVAEIALEEAQNAKSTVRLSRDAEGNFGYVYTADSKAVSEAQQQFDDAQNALYNKGLEGANDYAQKYESTMAEMSSTLQEIQENYLNGMYASEEEYQTATLEAKDYYYQKLADYSSLYQVALTADSAVAQEAWSTQFNSMVLDTDNWKQSVDLYLSQAKDAFDAWADVITTIEEESGLDLNNLAEKVKGITDESDALVSKLTDEGGVIDALQAELSEVNNLVTAYGAYRKAVQDTIKELETLGRTVNDKIVNLSVSTTTTTPSNTPISSETAASGNSRSGIISLNNTSSALTSIAMADSGGYTGEWGPEGKLAILHEKELILNKTETSQFLLGMEMLTSILATLDSYAMNQQYNGLLTSPGYVGDSTSTLEQNVHIEASFPGVTDRNEIEEAFNNLVNKASQYVNRK